MATLVGILITRAPFLNQNSPEWRPICIKTLIIVTLICGLLVAVIIKENNRSLYRDKQVTKVKLMTIINLFERMRKYTLSPI